MKNKWQLFLITFLIIISSSITAGELSQKLQNIITNKQPQEMVKVWIELPRFESAKQFQTSLVSSFKTRAQRHKYAIDELKINNRKTQESLLQYLKTLEKNNQARHIKPHWLVNLIEAEVPVEKLAELTKRSDIATIYTVPKIVPIIPMTQVKAAPSLSTGVESNLTDINAPAAWAAGYTGKGRVICSFDTGVDGLHPALYNNWKGLDGDSVAAWFDPAKHQAFPHTIPDCGFSSCNTNHGTHVMGIMVGHDNNSGDTVGVALDAKWISAAVIDINGVSIIDAFEWAADPDGDPNTIADVPDVINHSWGVSDIGCQNVFYNIIDNIEALGIVNIFAAGNEGNQGASTIRNPANRANDSLDCFAVGNIDASTNTIYSSSSRGPSDCNSAIKPNVVAPGTSIRSTLPNGNYGSYTGTSMAAPHVSALVALLRQKNPNATVNEIKNAILTSTDQLGRTLPNNDYGWGLIDCMAALNKISGTVASPNVKVYAFDHPPINPGDTVVGTVVLKNLGADVNSISANLVNNNSALTILNGSANFGTINNNDTVRSGDSIRVIVADTVTVGSILSLDFNITNGTYTTTAKLFFLVEPKLQRSFVTHNVGNIGFSLSNFGTFGLGADSFFPIGGVGFTYKDTVKDTVNDMFEGGLMIGKGLNQVSDGIRNAAGEPDGDFGVSPGGNIAFVSPMPSVTQETSSRFNDERAENPIGLEIAQNSYAFNYSPYQDFIILQYIIKNTTLSALNNIYVGLYLDWDITDYSQDAGGYESGDDFTWTAYKTTTILQNYRGVKIVDGNTVTSFTGTGDLVYYPEGFTESEKMSALIDGFGTADSLKDKANDLFQVVSTKIDLTPNQIDTVAFALLAGDNFADIQNAANQSLQAYLLNLTDVEDNTDITTLPDAFTLNQNYPNPFNPTTTISFTLKRASHYELTIYNLNGQKVDRIEGWAKAGQVNYKWNAQSYASGIYLYRLKAGDFTDSKKMLLLK